MNEVISSQGVSNKAITDVSDVYKDKDAFNRLWVMAQSISRSSLVPQTYQNKVEDCFIAIDMAVRMNVSPMVVMQNLYVVKGKPAWSGQACMTFIMNCGKFKHVHPVYVGNEGSDDWGCYVTAIRLLDGERVNGSKVTIAMAKQEGWYSKKDKTGRETSKWQSMPEQMLAYRAAAFFARVNCPESLMGVQTVEEVEDVTIEKEIEAAPDPFGGEADAADT